MYYQIELIFKIQNKVCYCCVRCVHFQIIIIHFLLDSMTEI